MTLHPIIAYLTRIMSPATDAVDSWDDRDDEAEDGAEPPVRDAAPVYAPPVVIDMPDQARDVVYERGRSIKGKRKRTLYPRVELARREVVIVLHQTGVQRAETSSRWHHVTAHYVITPGGRILHLHPIDVRLVAANRLDRSPYHAISIEFAGNFEGVDGTGRWFAGDRMGRGRASEAQVAAGRWLCRRLCRDVAAAGSSVAAIVPHRIAGRGRDGQPNRQLCPGSRVWSEVAERVCAADGVPIPAPGVTIGGAPIPDEWHGPMWPDIVRLGLASWRPG